MRWTASVVACVLLTCTSADASGHGERRIVTAADCPTLERDLAVAGLDFGHLALALPEGDWFLASCDAADDAVGVFLGHTPSYTASPDHLLVTAAIVRYIPDWVPANEAERVSALRGMGEWLAFLSCLHDPSRCSSWVGSLAIESHAGMTCAYVTDSHEDHGVEGREGETFVEINTHVICADPASHPQFVLWLAQQERAAPETRLRNADERRDHMERWLTTVRLTATPSTAGLAHPVGIDEVEPSRDVERESVPGRPDESQPDGEFDDYARLRERPTRSAACAAMPVRRAARGGLCRQ